MIRSAPFFTDGTAPRRAALTGLFVTAFMLAGATEGRVAAQANMWSGKPPATAPAEGPVYAPDSETPWAATRPAPEDDRYAPPDLDARLSAPVAPAAPAAPPASPYAAAPWGTPPLTPPAASGAGAGGGDNPTSTAPPVASPYSSSTGTVPSYGLPYGTGLYGALPYGGLPYGTGLWPYGAGAPGLGFGPFGFW